MTRKIPTPRTDALVKRHAGPFKSGITFDIGIAKPFAALARKLERERADLLDGLRHMRWCASCSQGSWEDCERGRAALAAITKAERPAEGLSEK